MLSNVTKEKNLHVEEQDNKVEEEAQKEDNEGGEA